MKAFPFKSHAAHGAVRNERRARQVAGIFQQSDKQEQQKDLGQEHQHGTHALPEAIQKKRPERPSGIKGAACCPSFVSRS
jgi:hypothetical protein